MKIAVIGSAGRTGRHVLAEGLRRGHRLSAFARCSRSLPQPEDLWRVVEGDGRDVEAVRRAVSDVDAVVSLVGGGTRERHQAEEVTSAVLQAMAAEQVGRLVVTSAYPIVATRPRVPVWMLNRIFATPYADMRATEALLRRSSADWTIVRLNRLTDATATKELEVSAGLLEHPSPTSRADAARLILDILESETAVQSALNVGGG